LTPATLTEVFCLSASVRVFHLPAISPIIADTSFTFPAESSILIPISANAPIA